MDSEDRFRIRTRLIIADFECPPEEITEILGINPTKTWLKGQPVTPKAKNTRKENAWELLIDFSPENNTVDAQVESLLSIITPNIEKFANLPSNVDIILSCVIFTRPDGFPVIGFSKKLIKILALINADIDIDLY